MRLAAGGRWVAVPAVAAVLAPPSDQVVRRLAGATMGTSWSVALVVPPRVDLAPFESAVIAVLDRVVEQMSSWRTDSTLSRYNRAAPESWHRLPAEFHQVLSRALAVAAQTDGAFDPALGRQVDAWGFGPATHPRGSVGQAAGRMPCELPGLGGTWRGVRIDPLGQQAWQPGGVSLDLSSIAKGFGVDEVARCLQRLGVAHFLVEVGGELRGHGVKPDGQPWWVAVEMPPNCSDAAGPPPQILLALHDLAVATSGDYRRSFEHGGQRFSHTIDPHTGAPVRNAPASVTVVGRDCMSADAMSTALLVMGLQTGLAFARQQGVAALFVERHETGCAVTASDAMVAMLQ